MLRSTLHVCEGTSDLHRHLYKEQVSHKEQMPAEYQTGQIHGYEIETSGELVKEEHDLA